MIAQELQILYTQHQRQNLNIKMSVVHLSDDVRRECKATIINAYVFYFHFLFQQHITPLIKTR